MMPKHFDRISPAILILLVLATLNLGPTGFAQQQPDLTLPTEQLKFGVFLVRFDPGGTFTLKGQGWPALNGNWKATGNEIELVMSEGPGGCNGPGKYRVRREGNRVGFDLVSDDCRPRRMIIDRSTLVACD